MAESTRFFAGASEIHDTLHELAKRLDGLAIPYVVVGGMALTAHGYARMTEDLDVLVTREDLRILHAKLDGLGYQRAFPGSKNLRDTTTGVKIEFVLTGDFPGSGKEQPVSFPDPRETDPVEHDGVKFIGLVRLVELKLASGMTGISVSSWGSHLPRGRRAFVEIARAGCVVRWLRSVGGGGRGGGADGGRQRA
jgi:hypothetical protein